MKPTQVWCRSISAEKFTFSAGFRQTNELRHSRFQHPIGWVAPRGRIDRTASEVYDTARSSAQSQLRTGGPADASLVRDCIAALDTGQSGLVQLSEFLNRRKRCSHRRTEVKLWECDFAPEEGSSLTNFTTVSIRRW